MSTVPGRKCCIKCEKNRATLLCGGCLQDFCFNHMLDHRQELNQQLNIIETSRNHCQQTLNEHTTDTENYFLLQQINDWERDSIRTIQNTAAEAREKLPKHVTDETIKIKEKLNVLTRQIQ